MQFELYRLHSEFVHEYFESRLAAQSIGDMLEGFIEITQEQFMGGLIAGINEAKAKQAVLKEQLQAANRLNAEFLLEIQAMKGNFSQMQRENQEKKQVKELQFNEYLLRETNILRTNHQAELMNVKQVMDAEVRELQSKLLNGDQLQDMVDRLKLEVDRRDEENKEQIKELQTLRESCRQIQRKASQISHKCQLREEQIRVESERSLEWKGKYESSQANCQLRVEALEAKQKQERETHQAVIQHLKNQHILQLEEVSLLSQSDSQRQEQKLQELRIQWEETLNQETTKMRVEISEINSRHQSDLDKMQLQIQLGQAQCSRMTTEKEELQLKITQIEAQLCHQSEEHDAIIKRGKEQFEKMLESRCELLREQVATYSLYLKIAQDEVAANEKERIELNQKHEKALLRQEQALQARKKEENISNEEQLLNRKGKIVDLCRKIEQLQERNVVLSEQIAAASHLRRVQTQKIIQLNAVIKNKEDAFQDSVLSQVEIRGKISRLVRRCGSMIRKLQGDIKQMKIEMEQFKWEAMAQCQKTFELTSSGLVGVLQRLLRKECNNCQNRVDQPPKDLHSRVKNITNKYKVLQQANRDHDVHLTGLLQSGPEATQF